MIDWESIHNSFIEKYKHQIFEDGEYTEKHHIIPKHSNGDNSPKNLIRLNIRQHILIHYILYRWKGLLGDKIAYLMKSGQTALGNRLRIQLSLATGREEFIRKSREDNCMKNPEIVKKVINTKLLRYNGKYFSDAGLTNIRNSLYKSIQRPDVQLRSQETCRKVIKSLSNDERNLRFARNGEQNGHYGKKRPNELAGNFGKSKGIYKFISPTAEIYEFAGIRAAMKYFDCCDSIIKKYTNVGKICRNKYKTNKFEAWEIIFTPNNEYGKNYNITKNKYKQ